MQTLFEMSLSWLNVPFRWHGRDKNGCDCIGLIIGVLYENNIIKQTDFERLDKITYGTNLSKIDIRLILQEMAHYFEEISDLECADLLLVALKNSPIHFVICERNEPTQQKKIIHISNEIGKVFETNFNQNFIIQKKFQLIL